MIDIANINDVVVSDSDSVGAADGVLLVARTTDADGWQRITMLQHDGVVQMSRAFRALRSGGIESKP